ncbi:hypothetical protein BOX15_Mlig005959g1, partial [Macrostomum lignano]
TMPSHKSKSRLFTVTNKLQSFIRRQRKDFGYLSSSSDSEATTLPASLGLSNSDGLSSESKSTQVGQQEAEPRQLTSSERHLISIHFAILQEQNETHRALREADDYESRNQVRERKKLDQQEPESPVNLSKVGKSCGTFAWSWHVRESDFIDYELEARKQKRRNSEWRRH